jgi:tetratricopeptide (TPR) repeat protein
MLQLGRREARNLDTATDCAPGLRAGSLMRWRYLGEVSQQWPQRRGAGALREAIARNPGYAEAHYLLAFVYGDIGRHEEAREATRHAIQLNPTLARAQANLALDRYAGHRPPADAAARSAKRPQIVEGVALAHYNLGLAFRQKALHEDALREYRQALEAGEDRRMTLQAMAEVHLLRRDQRC